MTALPPQIFTSSLADSSLGLAFPPSPTFKDPPNKPLGGASLSALRSPPGSHLHSPLQSKPGSPEHNRLKALLRSPSSLSPKAAGRHGKCQLNTKLQKSPSSPSFLELKHALGGVGELLKEGSRFFSCSPLGGGESRLAKRSFLDWHKKDQIGSHHPTMSCEPSGEEEESPKEYRTEGGYCLRCCREFPPAVTDITAGVCMICEGVLSPPGTIPPHMQKQATPQVSDPSSRAVSNEIKAEDLFTLGSGTDAGFLQQMIKLQELKEKADVVAAPEASDIASEVSRTAQTTSSKPVGSSLSSKDAGPTRILPGQNLEAVVGSREVSFTTTAASGFNMPTGQATVHLGGLTSDAALLAQKSFLKMSRGNMAGSKFDVDEALQYDENCSTAWRARARINELEGRPHDAVEDMREVLSMEQDLASDWHASGKLKLDIGDYDGAVEDCTRALEINAYSADTFNRRGLAEIRRRNPKKGEDDLTEAIRLDPYTSSHYQVRAEARIGLGKPHDAIVDLTQALYYDNSPQGPWTLRAKARRDYKDHGGCVRDCTQAIKKGYNEVEALNIRARSRIDTGVEAGIGTQAGIGDLRVAVEDCNSAIKIDPGHFEAWSVRADAKFKLGDYNGALADSTESLRLEPTDVATSILRGKIRFQKGYFDSAVDDFGNAIDYSPECFCGGTCLDCRNCEEAKMLLYRASQSSDQKKSWKLPILNPPSRRQPHALETAVLENVNSRTNTRLDTGFGVHTVFR
eukprot:TRINITY_DN21531_c0_g1_i1.p1 TRINITY_DN21531_c0_g1~~TRINITY_DN21531_c0_g1_i1.p1  ORF type:complete len:743 (+),score=129.04 TRINITY_DN21531_c0_g1_i1:156-2384(+)